MKLWSWGANNNGQLCHGFSSEQVSRPLQVQNHTIINLFESALQCSNANDDVKDTSVAQIKIEGGGTQTVISVNMDKKSHVICVGAKVPLKTSKNSPYPSLLSPKVFPVDFLVKDVACGWDFNLLLGQDRTVYSWGGNKYGQLGQESLCENLQQIPGFTAKKISAGLRHAAAIGEDGKLYHWGDNSKFQLGSTKGKILLEPTVLTAMDSPEFVDVGCGKGWTLCLSDDGVLWGCGMNKFGQLGAGEPLITSLTRLSLEFPNKIVKFCCGWNHVLALLDNGKTISWGRNNFSQLGRTTVGDVDACPKYVEDIPEVVTEIACGSEHNLALGQSGKVYAWGWNEHENCGMKSSRISFCEQSGVKLCEDCVVRPSVVDFPMPDKIVSIACGAGNGFALSL